MNMAELMQTTRKPEENYSRQLTGINELLFRIHTATGWRLPKTEQLCTILCRQLQKKLYFDYPMLTHDQIEEIFLKSGEEENFTGNMNIMQINKVLKKYGATLSEKEFENERHFVSHDTPKPTPTEHLHQTRELIEAKYQLFLERKMNIDLLPPFIFPVLCRDFAVDPELPFQFIHEAKEFIWNRKQETNKFGKVKPVIEVLVSSGIYVQGDLETTCVKLAIEYAFKQLSRMGYMNLYQHETTPF